MSSLEVNWRVHGLLTDRSSDLNMAWAFYVVQSLDSSVLCWVVWFSFSSGPVTIYVMRWANVNLKLIEPFVPRNWTSPSFYRWSSCPVFLFRFLSCLLSLKMSTPPVKRQAVAVKGFRKREASSSSDSSTEDVVTVPLQIGVDQPRGPRKVGSSIIRLFWRLHLCTVMCWKIIWNVCGLTVGSNSSLRVHLATKRVWTSSGEHQAHELKQLLLQNLVTRQVVPVSVAGSPATGAATVQVTASTSTAGTPQPGPITVKRQRWAILVLLEAIKGRLNLCVFSSVGHLRDRPSLFTLFSNLMLFTLYSGFHIYSYAVIVICYVTTFVIEEENHTGFQFVALSPPNVSRGI